MADEREVLKVSMGGNETLQETIQKSKEISDKIDPPEVKEALSRAERKARLATVLERGFVNERLHVDLPAHLHGEWAPIDQIEYYRTLGFVIDTEYARNRSIHARPELGGINCAVVGDVVYMVQSNEDYEIWNELRAERFEAMNRKPSKDGTTVEQLEEKNFKDLTETLTEGPVKVPVIDESKTRQARKEEISSSMAAAMARRQAREHSTS